MRPHHDGSEASYTNMYEGKYENEYDEKTVVIDR